MVDRKLVNEVKKEIITVMMILLDRGVFEYTAGHASCRVPGTDYILMPGHIHPEHRTIDSLQEDDIILVDSDGNLMEGKLSPLGERYIHTEIYKRRKDVGSVIHSHPVLANAFGIANQQILPISTHSTIFSPGIPIMKFSRQVDSPEAGAEVAQSLGEGFALLLQGHGAVAVGSSLRQACIVSILVEDTAQMQFYAHCIGTPQTIPAEFLDDEFMKGLSKEEFFGNPWDYYYNKYLNSHNKEK